MAITRRELLRGGAALAACASLPVWLEPRAGAQTRGPARRLIIVMGYGGWDQTYSLDPKPDLATIDAPEGARQLFGETPIWASASRPNVSEFFTAFGSIAAVLNGIQVRSFVHPDCVKRILTGTASDLSPDIGAIAAFDMAPDMPVPYLVLGSSAKSGPLAAFTGRAGTTNQVAALLSPAASYGTTDLPYVPAPGFVPTQTEEGLARDYIMAGAERLRATRGQRGYNQKRVDDFVESLRRADRLRAFASSGSGFGERNYTPDLRIQVPVGVTALENGLSHAVMMEMSSFDTHQMNTQQTMLQDTFYGGLLQLGRELESRAMLDDTVVLVVSEMGRTPKLNANGGKDHWPVASGLVFGAGVRGGRTYGASDDSLGARTIDLATGEPSEAGRQLQTGNLLAGVLTLAGVDPAPHFPDVEPFRAFIA